MNTTKADMHSYSLKLNVVKVEGNCSFSPFRSTKPFLICIPCCGHWIAGAYPSYTLDTSPVNHRTAHRQTAPHPELRDNLESSICL